MKQLKILYTAALLAFITTGFAATGNYTGSDNYTDTFKVQPGENTATVNVNNFGETIANITSIYKDNQSSSRNFNVKINGNVSSIVDTPESITLFENQSSGFPVVANVPLTQRFGSYKGNVTLTGQNNSNFTQSVNLTVDVVDNVDPEFTNVDIGSVQATQSVNWSVGVDDNLNVSNVSAGVVREVEADNGNKTILVNQSFKDSIDFTEVSQGSYRYSFTDTDEIGTYFLNVSVVDSSGNSVSRVERFSVDGLDSVTVLDSRPVFDTIRPKSRTSLELIENKVGGTRFSVVLDDFRYGGNESVRLGLRRVDTEGSPTFVEVNESAVFSDTGVYEVVVLHQGSGEIKGTHSFTGSFRVLKPGQHVSPVNESVEFSGVVKNVDKPPEVCERIAEFDACIGYGLDQSRALFEGRFGGIENGSRSYAYLIGRIPTSDVENSDSWGEESSLTFGQYNKTLNENKDLKSDLRDWKSKAGFRAAVLLWMPVLVLGVGGGSLLWWIKIGRYISLARGREKLIEKADIEIIEGGF